MLMSLFVIGEGLPRRARDAPVAPRRAVRAGPARGAPARCTTFAPRDAAADGADAAPPALPRHDLQLPGQLRARAARHRGRARRPYATTYLPLFVYRNAFEYLRYGYAAAATLVMFLVTAIDRLRPVPHHRPLAPRARGLKAWLLGSGGWIPTAERETACALLRRGDDALVLDAGTGLAAPRRRRRAARRRAARSTSCSRTSTSITCAVSRTCPRCRVTPTDLGARALALPALERRAPRTRCARRRSRRRTRASSGRSASSSPARRPSAASRSRRARSRCTGRRRPGSASATRSRSSRTRPTTRTAPSSPATSRICCTRPGRRRHPVARRRRHRRGGRSGRTRRRGPPPHARAYQPAARRTRASCSPDARRVAPAAGSLGRGRDRDRALNVKRAGPKARPRRTGGHRCATQPDRSIFHMLRPNVDV